MKPQSIIKIAAALGIVSVIMGAMGAHALKAVLEPESLQSYLTGTRYNMYHAIALLAIAGSSQFLHPKWMSVGVVLITIGTVLFSGSIYLLATRSATGLEGIGFLGPVTPFGGLLLIAGWAVMGLAAFRANKL